MTTCTYNTPMPTSFSDAICSLAYYLVDHCSTMERIIISCFTVPYLRYESFCPGIKVMPIGLSGSKSLRLKENQSVIQTVVTSGRHVIRMKTTWTFRAQAHLRPGTL